ncbi:MAG TPA: efflux RND transporter periplasmic adaptor subunit [Candidatus Paceibacterota bacterium]|nr:efflux RND transporter periplasmic adaptor subunit [Candidatus Paceibacterota bacterium]
MLQSIFARLQDFVSYLTRTAKRLGWKKLAAGAGVLVVLLIVLHAAFSGGASEAAAPNNTRSVELRSIADLSNQTSGLSVAGTVSSKSEATVRAEKSGEITSLNYQLGDYVGAGAVVAEVENASERAAVLQAQAGVEAAQASAGISGTSAASALLSAYAAADNAVHNAADPMFINPDTTPHTYYLRVKTEDSASKREAESLRSALDAALDRQKAASAQISSASDQSGELAQTEAELQQVRNFLDALLRALNAGEPDEVVTASVLDGYKAATIAARTAVTASITALGSARQSIAGTGANASVSAAAVKQAQAGLASARANLEHTLIRAPISGTINSLSLKRGDYVQLGSAVLTVANNGALEVVAYVTESDARQLAVGGKAKLGGSADGVITRIAPAIDPVTKKIEVRVGISGSATALINGQSVTVELARAQNAATAAAPARLVIPLAALKIGQGGMSVFTVDANNMLVAHTVTIGELLGDRVVILDGATPDMLIVTDARGLRARETVEVAQ